MAPPKRFTRLLLVVATWCVTIYALEATVAQAAAFENQSSAPRDLYTARGAAYFSADDGFHGRELWRSDGTEAGTSLLMDTVPGPLSGNPEWFASTDGLLFFVVTASENQRRVLWMSDGSAAGTKRVAFPPLDNSWILQPLSSNGEQVFCVTERSGYTEVVQTDGTRDGTFAVGSTEGKLQVTQFYANQVTAENFIHTPRETVFSMARSIVYRLPRGARLAEEWGSNNHTILMGAIGDVVLVSYQDDLGQELFRMTEGGLGELIRDIYPGEAPGIEDVWNEYVRVEDRLYFRANDGVHGAELWCSDGSESGTYLVKDINPGRVSTNVGGFTTTSKRLFFVADDNIHGYELWSTDGTSEGTHMARDVNPGARSSNPYRLCVVGDVVYFSALNERWGEELWRSDGTELGTHLVRDIVVGAAGSEPYYKAPLGDALLFSARDSEHGFELWITDGSEGNTRLLRDIAPTMGVNPSSEPELLYAADPLLYFSLRTGPAGVELWRSDGSDGGTFMVKDLFPGPPSSNPGNFCAQGTVLYFAAESANAGIELWRTEGRAVSTSMVCDIAEGSDSSSPTGLVKLDSTTIIFAANDGINGMELWGSDGTPQGTKLIRNLHDDTDTPQGSYPQNLTRVGELVYFRADDGIHGSELWVTDGTYGGTRIVKDLIPRHNFSADPKSLTSVGNTLFYKSLPDGAGRWLQRIQEAGDGNTVANPSLLEPSEE